MRCLKVIVIVSLLMTLGMLPGIKTAREATAAAREISVEQFYDEFIAALEINNTKRIQQLARDNPNTAEELHQRLVFAGEGTGEEARQYRALAEILEQFLPNDLPRFSLERLQKEGEEAYDASDYSTALKKWETGLNQAYISGDQRYMSQFLFKIGALYAELREYEQALEYYKQALPIDRETGDRSGEGGLLGNIGAAYTELGEYEQALGYYEQALTITRELGDRDEEGAILSNLGVLYDNFGEYEQALEYYEQALAIDREVGDRRGEGAALTNIGILYSNLGEYEQALKFYEQALVIHQEIGARASEGLTMNSIGIEYAELGQYEKALRYYEQALEIHREIGDRSGEGKVLDNIGNVYSNQGQYGYALEYHKQALEIYREIDSQDGEGTALTNIGVVYWYLGQYEQAMDYHRQALAINRKIGNHRTEGAALTNIGIVYNDLGQYEQALGYHEQALKIAREIEDQNGEVIALINLGTVYKNLGQYERAREYYELAIVFMRGDEDRDDEMEALNLLSEIYGFLEQDEQAREYYEQALALTREIGDRSSEGAILNNISRVYRNSGQNERALESYKQALEIYQEIGDRSSEGTVLTNIGMVYSELGQHERAGRTLMASLAVAHEIGRPEALWKVQAGLGEVNARLGKQNEAVMHYEQALDTIESMRAVLSKKETKISFMQEKLPVYDSLIDLLQDLHQKYPDKGYSRKSLEIFERKQGRVFLEEMGQSGARLFAGISESILQDERDLENQLAQTRKQLVDERSKIITEQNKELIQTLEQHEKSIQAEQEVLQTTIKTDYPDYYALRYPKPALLSDLQQNVLQSGELMLVYGIMQDRTVLWVVSKENFNLVVLDISEEDLHKEVEAFRAAPNAIIEAVSSGQQLKAIRLAGDTLDDMAQAGYGLYQELFPEAVCPLVAQTQTLYIIPTGPLYGLPFEALVTEAPEEDEAPHYLLQDHSITYLSSASLLKILRDAQKRRKQTTMYPLLAFADPEYPETCQATRETITRPIETARTDVYLKSLGKKTCFSKQDELPETKREVEAIAKILDAPDDSVPLQLREQASRSTVLQFNEQERLDDYRYLLFSAHAILPGEVDHINQPAIVLSHPEKEGYLTMADAFALQLNADFVALSACNTGRGEQIRGEGIMGLTRAFMYAGTPAVGVTLWSVDSKASSEINTRFFRHLKAGKNLADALRQAKLDLLAEAEEDSDLEHFRHPFFWAPFVVFGDTSSK